MNDLSKPQSAVEWLLDQTEACAQLRREREDAEIQEAFFRQCMEDDMPTAAMKAYFGADYEGLLNWYEGEKLNTPQDERYLDDPRRGQAAEINRRFER